MAPMKHIKSFENINEAASSDDMCVYQVTCRDSNQSLKKLIEYIGQNGNTGHSFSIIVDPDGDKDQKKTFGWDGDGSDRIESVEVIKEPKKDKK